MSGPNDVFRLNDVRLWLDPDGGIMLQAVSQGGDPVELNSSEIRRLAAHLLVLADEYDAN